MTTQRIKVNISPKERTQRSTRRKDKQHRWTETDGNVSPRSIPSQWNIVSLQSLAGCGRAESWEVCRVFLLQKRDSSWSCPSLMNQAEAPWSCGPHRSQMGPWLHTHPQTGGKQPAPISTEGKLANSNFFFHIWLSENMRRVAGEDLQQSSASKVTNKKIDCIKNIID